MKFKIEKKNSGFTCEKCVNIKNMKTWFYLLLTLLVSNTAFSQTCTSGDCQNGYGIQKYTNGEEYLGEFKDNIRDGQGVTFYPNGEKYVGSWKKDKRDGEGRIYKNNRLIKSGIWKSNRLPTLSYLQNGCLTGNCMSGFGIFLYQDGRKVYGIFEHGEIKDYTVCYYPDGSKYIGNWKNQGRYNLGTYYSADGSIQKGVWTNDKLVKETNETRDKGCIVGNCVNGKGGYKFSNYSYYHGYFFGEKADGLGVCIYPDGDAYLGEWSNHKFEGQGTMYYNDGTILNGIWKNGLFQKVIEKEIPTRSLGYEFIDKPTYGKVWVLLIGVSDYINLPDLKYTDNDAFRLHSFFKSPTGGAIPNEQMTILIDEQATQNNILKHLQLISRKAGKNDLVLFYFSGHGFRGSFAPHDYKENSEILVKHNEVIEILKMSKAKSKVVIADACHSGSMDTKSGNYESLLDIYYNAFRKSMGGTVLLLSSRANEVSMESTGLCQGLYSHFLLEGLNGKANKNGDKIITVSELHQYIYKKVRSATSYSQTPVIHGDFDVNMPMSVAN
jgi:hypothetical protein